jgi:hypothetical protein
MAFLDNSGDIILDAVLTETGRRKMARGEFRIVKFALGDDEIDYSLYNKNHPSGSAYYDLEILQTPVFEAFTQINAGINYGLLPTTATDLLYLPVAKTNELLDMQLNNVAKSSGVYYIIDTSGDTDPGAAATGIVKAMQEANITYIQGYGNSSNNFVLVETGIDTGVGSVPVGTEANRTSYLVNNSLVDTGFYAYYDNRLFTACAGPAANSTFSNDGADNSFNGAVSLEAASQISISIGLENYIASRLSAVSNKVFWYSNNTAQNYSVIGGPRAAATAVSPVVKVGLEAEYSLYGSTGVAGSTLFPGVSAISSTNFNYIDSTIYVQGIESPAQVQIPVRIIRIQ